MAEKNYTFVVDKDNLEIRTSRIFNAPINLVFRAYSDPELLTKWWGPSYLKNTIEKMDFKVGGEWRIIQTDPKGEEYAFSGVYKEIVKPEKITWTFNFEPIGPGHEAVETVSFKDLGDKTEMSTVSKYKTLDDLKGMAESGMESGMAEGFERMDKVLASLVEQQ